MNNPWPVETVTGPVARLLELPVGHQRAVRFLVPEDRGVVLGSTQPAADIDHDRATRAGLTVTRRASGGGAVLVGPGQLLWADVLVPTGDQRWTNDVGRAFWWLGDVWAAALSAAGLPGGEVWRGRLVRSPWSSRICFAGLGSGEVSLGRSKVVGLSQRRTRAGAHFQCAVLIRWAPSELLAVMALEDGIRTAGATELADVAIGVGGDVASALIPAFVDCLAREGR